MTAIGENKATSCMAGERPVVAINCLVYNHERYLRDCLDGFVMQKTSFKFEAIVHDDASTDGSAAIIMEYAAKYPDIIKPIYEVENQYSKHDGTISRIMKSHTRTAKYVAWCEGDDFWTDPLKLQKEVDLLESNPDASFVHTGFRTVDEGGNEIKDEYYASLIGRSHDGYRFFDLLLNCNYIMTVTFMARQSVVGSYPDGYYDYGLFLVASRMGRGLYLREETASYRINPTSIIRTAKDSLIPFTKQIVYEQICAILDKDGLTCLEIDRHPMKNAVMGWMICRYFRLDGPRRCQYILLVIRHPSMLLHIMRAIIAKMSHDDRLSQRAAMA